jgi:eukaryotic-like serine/threonine-protein kinase
VTNHSFCRTLAGQITLPDTIETPSEVRSGALAREKEPAPLRLGERVPGTPWIVVRSIGKGGMSEVFEVEHALLGRPAALKVLHADLLHRYGLAARIADEGRLLASVDHPNLVDVLDLGLLDPDGRPYLVLELCDGRDLRAELARVGVLSVPAALGIAAEVLAGLGALHRAGIVHRDIKLENLALCADGRVKILDLGAAEPVDRSASSSRRGPALGTPRTMAPEQSEGKPIDGRADLYALGLVLYELVAGRGPFDDVAGLDALRFAHAARRPPPPSRFAPQPVPPELDALILRALEKSPDDRFPSADVMAAEIVALRRSSQRLPEGHVHRETERALSFVSTCPSAAPVAFSEDRSAPQAPLVPANDTTFRAVASALAIAALALGLVVGRLLPSPAAPGPGASAAAVR